MLSNDPFFIEKVCDIVELYLNTPEHTLMPATTHLVSGIVQKPRHPVGHAKAARYGSN
ncbi:MAG: hypothetical protein M0R28_16875 [Pigmentiphaga sp.]|nr:hypothetical protein [Pigmentiphaga sp.]